MNEILDVSRRNAGAVRHRDPGGQGIGNIATTGGSFGRRPGNRRSLAALGVEPQHCLAERAGVDVNKTYHHDLTALMWAAGSGKTETVKLLVERGADISRKDDRGKTAGEIARDAKHAETAALLEKP